MLEEVAIKGIYDDEEVKQNHRILTQSTPPIIKEDIFSKRGIIVPPTSSHQNMFNAMHDHLLHNN